MNVESWHIDDVTPYENNPRNNDDAVEKVANSIREFGWQQPIVVDEGGVIIAGHTRYKAAQMLGLSEVPVTVAEGLSDNQVQAYRLADNKTSEFADWDFDKLNEELESIDWSDCNMEQFGFFVGGEIMEDESSLMEEYKNDMGTVIYEPKETFHKPEDLYEVDYERFSEVISKVENGEIREMLNTRAMWFAEFNFAKIADYYAYQATPDEQKAFESLGLVILDKDKLIENGYANTVCGIVGGISGDEDE